MKIFGLIKLDEYKRAHANVRGALDQWQLDVERSHWSGPQDVKNRYPSASILIGNKVIFNIKGNRYRLVVKAKYEKGIVLIEWVGTHAEYSKKSFQ
jgi:mRNA interferase HigB